MNMSMYQDVLSAGLFKSCCSGWHNYYHTSAVDEEKSEGEIATIVVDSQGHESQLA